VRYFFDTSVLVAAISVPHMHHARSQAAYLSAAKANFSCAAHSLAEVYSTLTRFPGKQRMTCEQALLFVEEIRQRFTAVALDEDEYWSAINDSAAQGVTGGTIYDALIARCAVKAKAGTLFTWNVAHFRRLGPDIARRVQTP